MYFKNYVFVKTKKLNIVFDSLNTSSGDEDELWGRGRGRAVTRHFFFTSDIHVM